MDEIPQLDEIFHTPARLGIMALLLTWRHGTFNDLKQALNLTDGNLGAHLRTLEDAGFVKLEKRFENRKPKTICRTTPEGKKAFAGYLVKLERVIEVARS